MLVPAALAERIRSEMGFPTPVSAQLLGWATGVIGEITANAKVNNAPGTITGTVPPAGGALISGAGMMGLISAMVGSSMATKVVAAVPYPFVSTQLTKFCVEIVSHIQTLGTVNFDAGNITGICTNAILPPAILVPGSLTNGAGAMGYIIGLNGPVLAAAIHASVGYPGSVSTRLTQFCTAITGYIMDNAVVTYASGTVTGTCPGGGGSLGSGAGSNGTIA